jgi:hypothetical protein
MTDRVIDDGTQIRRCEARSDEAIQLDGSNLIAPGILSGLLRFARNDGFAIGDLFSIGDGIQTRHCEARSDEPIQLGGSNLIAPGILSGLLRFARNDGSWTRPKRRSMHPIHDAKQPGETEGSPATLHMFCLCLVNEATSGGAAHLHR